MIDDVLGLASGVDEDKSVPWAKLTTHTSHFIQDEYYPKGIEWRDPVRMAGKHVEDTFKHWFDRQDKGLRYFAFNFVLQVEGKHEKYVLACKRYRELGPQR